MFAKSMINYLDECHPNKAASHHGHREDLVKFEDKINRREVISPTEFAYAFNCFLCDTPLTPQNFPTVPQTNTLLTESETKAALQEIEKWKGSQEETWQMRGVLLKFILAFATSSFHLLTYPCASSLHKTTTTEAALFKKAYNKYMDNQIAIAVACSRVSAPIASSTQTVQAVSISASPSSSQQPICEGRQSPR